MTEDLKLAAGPTSVPASSGCACCAPADTAGATSNPAEASAPASSTEVSSEVSDAVSNAEESAAVRASYQVIGMTCGHCVSAVRSELSAVPGVREVDIDLVVGGASTVTVTSDAALELDTVAGAVDEAGYELAGQPS